VTPRTDAGNNLGCALAANRSIERDQAGNGFVTAGDDNFLTGLDPVQQLANGLVRGFHSLSLPHFGNSSVQTHGRVTTATTKGSGLA
jgi:hypothetical protein